MNYHQLMRRLATILAPKEGWGKRKIISIGGFLWPGKVIHGMNGKRAMERRRRQIERGILKVSKP